MGCLCRRADLFARVLDRHSGRAPGVDSDAKCNPVDSIGSSAKSRVSHSERRPPARFQGTKTARREGISSPFSDVGGCTSPQNSGPVRSDRGRVEHHLKPLLGKKRADAISRADIERLLNDVKSGRTSAAAPEKRRPGSIATGGAGVAAQCVALASTVLQFGVDRGAREDNPARGVKKPPVRKMQRFLTESELRKLAESL